MNFASGLLTGTTASSEHALRILNRPHSIRRVTGYSEYYSQLK